MDNQPELTVCRSTIRFDERNRLARYWKRHPKKDLEALLGKFHEAGWRIENPP